MDSLWDQVVDAHAKCAQALQEAADLHAVAGNRKRALDAAKRAATANARYERLLAQRQKLVDSQGRR
jgi:hypothetical protein